MVEIFDLTATLEHTRCGCFYKSTCVSIVMYADDILLLSPLVTARQDLLHVCESALSSLDLFINPKKSVCYCMRIGPRFLANVKSSSCSLYVVVRPSVCRLSSVCNVYAPYSGD